jgi:6-pyruvoyltetrahydropterin/6-carboxytetrahydropterin synthase
MGYTISKTFGFAASHQLRRLPEGHPCGRLHGHNYTVTVELAGDGLDEAGMLFDYRALQPFKAWLDEYLDHRHLNDYLADPTAERLAAALHQAARERLPGAPISRVGVQETPGTWAWYRP